MAKSIVIRIIGKTSSPAVYGGAVLNTTIDKEYTALLFSEGEYDSDGGYCDEDGIEFFDDVGDRCFAYTRAHLGYTIQIVAGE